MIFTTCGQKGGSGRSTIAENLAVWLHHKGCDVLAIDADDQGTLMDFTAWREENRGSSGYTFVQLTGPSLRKQVEAMKPKYDHIVIDVGGRDTTSQRAALYVADIALIPIQPRSHDVWTLEKLVTMLDEVQTTRAVPLVVRTFLNRADITSQENRDAAQALSEMPELGFLPHSIKNRKAYPSAGAKGLAVFEMEQPDLKAVNEINTLFNAVYGTVTIATEKEADRSRG